MNDGSEFQNRIVYTLYKNFYSENFYLKYDGRVRI